MQESGADHVRLFVALELPAELLTALEAWRAPLAAADALRLIPAASLHVTLCFLGSQPADAIERIGADIQVVRRAGAAKVSPAGALWLPRRRPNVLAVRLEDHGGALANMQALLAHRLAGGGWYERERRPFLPHVTVARVRRKEAAMADTLPPLPDGTREQVFAADRVTLFRSHLSSAGTHYAPLASLRLGETP